MKTKGKLKASGSSIAGLRIQQIRFVNRRRFLQLSFLALAPRRIRKPARARSFAENLGMDVGPEILPPIESRVERERHSRFLPRPCRRAVSEVSTGSSPSSPRATTSWRDGKLPRPFVK